MYVRIAESMLSFAAITLEAIAVELSDKFYIKTRVCRDGINRPIIAMTFDDAKWAIVDLLRLPPSRLKITFYISHGMPACVRETVLDDDVVVNLATMYKNFFVFEQPI